jgi:hypothetical protein
LGVDYQNFRKPCEIKKNRVFNSFRAKFIISLDYPSDIKREFEAATRHFWKEWAEFEKTLAFLPRDATCRGHAQVLLQTYGVKGQDNINKSTELFTLSLNKKITKNLLQLMCSSNLNLDLEDEDLFNKQKEVELVLLQYQRHFLKNPVFH